MILLESSPVSVLGLRMVQEIMDHIIKHISNSGASYYRRGVGLWGKQFDKRSEEAEEDHITRYHRENQPQSIHREGVMDSVHKEMRS